MLKKDLYPVGQVDKVYCSCVLKLNILWLWVFSLAPLRTMIAMNRQSIAISQAYTYKRIEDKSHLQNFE